MRLSHSAAAAAFVAGLAAVGMAAPTASQAQISIGLSINIAPPALPVYVQPAIPAPGYLWTPGYWAWDPTFGDYYWVPGTWVQPPRVGLLWTPGYWGWNNGLYVFNDGYWGPHIGFYGGVNYGYGYGGSGYEGGAWRGGQFFYNRSVNNVTNVHITNVYNQPVTNVTNNHVSFNGGAGGVAARPTAEQLAAVHEPHVAPTPIQQQHAKVASQDRSLRASVNHGAPPIAATARPAALHGPGVVAAAHAAPLSPEHAPNTDSAARPAQAAAPRGGEASPRAEHPAATASAPYHAPSAASAPRPAHAEAPRPAPHPAPQAKPAPQHPAAPKPAGGEHREDEHHG